MDEITKEEAEEFWKWCGFTKTSKGVIYGDAIMIDDSCHHIMELPPIDLNNLFRYAVPKLEDSSLRITFSLGMEVNDASLYWHVSVFDKWYPHKDPAVALFRAIQGVIRDAQG